MKPDTSKGILVIIEDPIQEVYDKSSINWERSGNPHFTTEKVALLHEKYGIDPAFFHKSYVTIEDYAHNSHVIVQHEVSSRLKFKPYEKCNLQQKQGCKEVEAKLQEIINSESSEYDEPVTVSVGARLPRSYSREFISIETTLRDLAKAGILPETYRCETRARVSENDIAKATRGNAITSTDMEPLKKGGFKKWLENLKEAFKNMVTGKGEK